MGCMNTARHLNKMDKLIMIFRRVYTVQPTRSSNTKIWNIINARLQSTNSKKMKFSFSFGILMDYSIYDAREKKLPCG